MGVDLSPATFKPLDRDLTDAALAETSMDLYGVDGYLAALLSGPRTFMPSEWVPWIWDSECRERAPEFENLEQAQEIGTGRSPANPSRVPRRTR